MKNLWIKTSIIGGLFTVLANGYAAEGDSGSFFNVSAIGPNLQITKTLSWPYPNAGISMNTNGFSLTSPGVDCTLSSNGQCLFSLNSSATKSVGITGPSGNVGVKLCEDGAGPLHCQTPTVRGNRFIYVANFDATSAYMCNLNTATQLIADITTCTLMTPTSVTINDPQGVALNPSGSFIYYVNNDNPVANDKVVFCPINSSTGVEIDGSCTGVTNVFIGPIGITFNSTGTYAYIVQGETTGDRVMKCNANSSTGALTSCAATTDYNWNTGCGGGACQAYAMAFNPSGTFAYITQIAGGNVVQCSVTPSTGALTGCVNALAAAIFLPTSIAINSTGTFAFIASQGSNPDLYACPINTSTGNLGTCASYDLASNAGDLFGLALASTDNMLYITSYVTDKLYECSVNSSTGVVSTPCTEISWSPPTFNGTPFGVALR